MREEYLIEALKEIASLTQNPREYEPSLYTLNHLARTALEKYENTILINLENGSKIETIKSENVIRGRSKDVSID